MGNNTGYRLLKSMYRDQITHPSHLAPCRSTICHPPPKVSHKTLHVREMVRAETNAADNLRKAKSDLYSLEADLLAIQRDLERQRFFRQRHWGGTGNLDLHKDYDYTYQVQEPKKNFVGKYGIMMKENFDEFEEDFLNRFYDVSNVRGNISSKLDDMMCKVGRFNATMDEKKKVQRLSHRYRHMYEINTTTSRISLLVSTKTSQESRRPCRPENFARNACRICDSKVIYRSLNARR